MNIKYIILNDSVSLNDMERYLPLLPEERRQKTERYRFEQDKLTSLIAGLLIRNETGGRELCFGEYRKPYIRDCSDLFFSVSHSGNCIAIAVDSVELGVDVEMIRTKDIEKLAQRFYSKGERIFFLQSLDKPSSFTEIWTRKEAYLKCKGTGIAEDLTAFDTTGEELSRHLMTVPLDGYVLSVCSKETIRETDIQISRIELKDIV